MLPQEFILASESALERLMRPVSGVPEKLFDEPMSETEPSFKSVIESLSLFNTTAVKSLEALYRGEEMVPDNYDDASTVLDPSKPYKRVVAELRITHSTVMAALERIPKEKLENGEVPEWLIDLVLKNYQKYIPEVEAWVARIKKEGRSGATSLPVIN